MEREKKKEALAAMSLLSHIIENDEFKQYIQNGLQKHYLSQLQYYLNMAGEGLRHELQESANHGPLSTILAAGNRSYAPMNMMASYTVTEK
jgi:hypothetical protein